MQQDWVKKGMKDADKGSNLFEVAMTALRRKKVEESADELRASRYELLRENEELENTYEELQDQMDAMIEDRERLVAIKVAHGSHVQTSIFQLHVYTQPYCNVAQLQSQPPSRFR